MSTQKNTTCYIHGFGIHVPERILTNEELSTIVDTSDEWITSRTGIKNRHILAEGENGSDLGVKATQNALAEAGLNASDITHILVATCTPDYMCPSTSSILAKNLGCKTVMAFDFNAACSGFLYGLSLCESILTTHQDAVVLLVCVEALTRRINFADRSTCVLFGDGAGAMVMRANKDNALAKVHSVMCHTDGNLWDLITIGGGTRQTYAINDSIQDEFFLHMQGREVFKHAVRNLVSVAHEVLAYSGLSLEDIDLYVPHQANLRIIEAVGSRLHLAEEKIFANVHKYGNTSSASVPLALFDARAQNRIAKQSKVMVASVGAGFTWGAGIIDFY